MKKLVVFWGDSFGGTLKVVSKHERPRPAFIPFRDNLAVGPLRPLDDLNAFFAERAVYWLTPDVPGESRPGDILRDLRKPIDRLTAGLESCDVCEIWLGASTGEQFLAAFLVGLCDAGVLDGTKMVFRQFTCDDRGPCLSCYPVDFFHCLPEAQPLSALRSAYLNAWSALADSDMTSSWNAFACKTGVLDLDAALSVFRLRYPDAETGLGSIDSALLAQAKKDWVPSAYVVGNALAARTPNCDLVGDGVLFAHQKALGIGPNPLVELRGKLDTMGHCEARLTPFGADCLAGRANRLANGIDEWIGGVHLSSAAGRLWVRDVDRIVPA